MKRNIEEKKTQSPPQTGIETLAVESVLICNTNVVLASMSQRPQTNYSNFLLDLLQWHLDLHSFESFVTPSALKELKLILT